MEAMKIHNAFGHLRVLNHIQNTIRRYSSSAILYRMQERRYTTGLRHFNDLCTCRTICDNLISLSTCSSACIFRCIFSGRSVSSSPSLMMSSVVEKSDAPQKHAADKTSTCRVQVKLSPFLACIKQKPLYRFSFIVKFL